MNKKQNSNLRDDKILKYTRQIAGKQPPLIPISMIGIEIIEDIENKRFLYKNILKVRFILMAFRSWT